MNYYWYKWYITLVTINAVYVKRVDGEASDIPLVQGRTVSLSLVHMQVQNSRYVDVCGAPAILSAQSITRDRIFSVIAGTRAASNQTNCMHARREKEPVLKITCKYINPLLQLTWGVWTLHTSEVTIYNYVEEEGTHAK